MNSNHSLLSVLKKPASAITALAFAFLFFDLQYYMMANLPGSRDEMCVMGAGLNTSNIIFALIMSLMVGILIVGLFQTIRSKQPSYSVMTLTGIGTLFGGLTVFCTACTLPVIALFGWSIGISFFTFYSGWFKALSLILLAIGLYQVDLQLKGKCSRCVD